jgi:hypothetical protein
MRCPGSVRLSIVAVVGVAVSGCSMTHPLIHRVSNEFECAPARINVVARRDVSFELYDVEACGHRARYSCVGGGRYEPYHCVHEPDPPKWDPDPALAASLPHGPPSRFTGADPSEGTWRRICGSQGDDACAFWQDGTWSWRPARVPPCGGGYGTVCD